MTNKYYSYRLFQTFHHFPEYVAARDKLIPEAEARAYEVAGRKPFVEGGCQTQEGRDLMKNWGDEWNREFFGEMNRLAVSAGLLHA